MDIVRLKTLAFYCVWREISLKCWYQIIVNVACCFTGSCDKTYSSIGRTEIHSALRVQDHLSEKYDV